MFHNYRDEPAYLYKMLKHDDRFRDGAVCSNIAKRGNTIITNISKTKESTKNPSTIIMNNNSNCQQSV